MGDEHLPKRSPDKNPKLVMINSIYNVKYSVRNSLDNLKDIHCLMMGNELLPKRSPDINLRLVMINGIYHVKYRISAVSPVRSGSNFVTGNKVITTIKEGTIGYK